MAADIDMEEQEYIDGFNLGYKMAKYSPEIAELIDHATGGTGKLAAIKAGKEQYINEEFENRLPAWLKKEDAAKNISGQDREPSKDIDQDIEPEL